MTGKAIPLPVGGFLPQSLVDFPGRIAAVVYTSGCNFRCPFCHNPELVLPDEFGAPPLLEFDDVLERITRNRSLLGGVVVTGGEPTIHKSLPDALRMFKGLGLEVKLDTNGSRPEMLEELLEGELVDEVAMDIKAPFELDRYSALSGISCTPVLLGRIRDSILLLLRSGVKTHFRTTLVGELHSKDDVRIMKELCGGKINFQPYRAGKTLAMPTSEQHDSFGQLAFSLAERSGRA
ncbi:MAG: anaerobic ribonucleoside-triphosphate reductase activating protein [Candidatus Chlorobium antarcticum]|jgi:pyruvate formate lyase activating enzyme|nr:anaerobic ribonucleoside-triphosphate reductase activating protein [Candidatus Chlorobium antarcticum]